MRRPSRTVLLWSLAALVLMGALGGYYLSVRFTDTRRQLVADRGALVMPFDLERTTHVFEPQPDGGVQAVVADDPRNQDQVALIRRYLRKEAASFSEGRFDDPAFIHGADMPGLAELEAGAYRIAVEYEAVPGGARIRYAAEDKDLVAALHAWFEAQAFDHGDHARVNH